MENKADADQKKEDREQVVELGSDITKSSKGNIYTLTIIGQVEGHQVLPETAKTTKYEHVLPLLAGIEESDEIDGIDDDVYDGGCEIDEVVEVIDSIDMDDDDDPEDGTECEFAEIATDIPSIDVPAVIRKPDVDE